MLLAIEHCIIVEVQRNSPLRFKIIPHFSDNRCDNISEVSRKDIGRTEDSCWLFGILQKDRIISDKHREVAGQALHDTGTGIQDT